MQTDNSPILYLFAGLPGSGKTSLARLLALETGAVLLRIDTVEQALRDLCNVSVTGEGYRLAYRLAEDNLILGNSVIADCCNPIELTRNEWLQVADNAGAQAVNVEIVCSDKDEHRRRVEQRQSDIENLRLPTWEEVCIGDYLNWTQEKITIDTASATPDESFELLQRILRESLPAATH